MKTKNKSTSSTVTTNNTDKNVSMRPGSPDSGMQMSDEFKDQNFKYNLSKFEYDLYHDEDNIVEKVIRVKRFSLPNNGEKWKIFEDNKAVYIVEGTKLTKKEKEFLRSVDGVTFLVQQYKLGINSFNHLKTELRKRIK
jgi:hypothetical protein